MKLHAVNYPVNETLEKWIIEAYTTNKRIVVNNSGGLEAILQNRIYTINDRGQMKEIKKDKTALISIFKRLALKYGNITVDDKIYMFSRGSWNVYRN